MKSRKHRKSIRWMLIGVILLSWGLSDTSHAADNVHYYYDDVNRLIRTENDITGQIVEFQYDAVGNRLQKRGYAPLTIAATSGSNGSITPSGTIVTPYNSSQTFVITPSGSYEILDVAVDGSSVGPVSSYTFGNVTANHAISAGFVVYTLPVNTGSGYYATLQAAYDAAAAGSTIKVKAATFTENLNVNRNIAVTIEGGYNPDYTSIIGKTTLKGQIRTYTGGGTLTIKNFILNNQ